MCHSVINGIKAWTEDNAIWITGSCIPEKDKCDADADSHKKQTDQ